MSEETSPEIPVERFAITLRMTEDRMALLLSGKLHSHEWEDFVQAVSEELKNMGMAADHIDEECLPVVHARLKEAVGAIEAELTEEDEQAREMALDQALIELNDAVIGQGKAAVPPEDGKIIWARDFFKGGFEIDERTGAADYRKRAAKLSVAEGELLATIEPPSEGGEGVDALGRLIKPRKARPARLRVGPNVRKEEDVDTFYATANGRVRYANDMLSVDDVFTVPGSVGLATGHIEHPGALVVSENIEGGSEVRAAGSIEVNGYVEDAYIRTEGSLLVRGGISGGTGCTIKVNGGVYAKFMQNASIEAEDDVVVEREVDQCVIKTRGQVKVLRGRIVGGEVTALGGIEADQLGSEACVHTHLYAGQDYTLQPRIEEREKQLEKQKRTLDKINQKLQPLHETNKELSPKVREVVTLLMQEAKKLEENIEHLEQELESIRAETQDRAKHEILARRQVFPDTVFHIHPFEMHVNDTVDGPVKAAIREGELSLAQVRLNR